MGNRIQFAEKIDSFKIFIAYVLIRRTVIVFAGIIQIEHGGHRIHSEAVKMKLFQPENRAGE